VIPETAIAFLKQLVETPSPSGFEEPNAEHFRQYVGTFADNVETDPLGSVIATVNPGGYPKVMLAGHIDEIGFLIHYIDESGYCYFKGIGGHDLSNAVGQRLVIHTARGPVNGVIGKKPIHLLKPDERGKSVSYEDLWIDIGCTSKDETVAAGVRVGDPATYTDGWTQLAGDRVTARAFDNRVGAWVVAEALRRVKEMNPQAEVVAVATVQEEIGLRGARASAFGVDPQIGIAVDVTFATDFPSMDKRKTSELKLGAGPTILRGANANRKLSDRLIAVAEENAIPFQLEADPAGTGTDANAMQISRGGMITGLVGIPLRYMHTPCEIISLADADNAAELLARACASLGKDERWIP
jgi:endoglucanase